MKLHPIRSAFIAATAIAILLPPANAFTSSAAVARDMNKLTTFETEARLAQMERDACERADMGDYLTVSPLAAALKVGGGYVGMALMVGNNGSMPLYDVVMREITEDERPGHAPMTLCHDPQPARGPVIALGE